MQIGSILKNINDGIVLGAVVYTFPNKLILFRTVNGMEPSFTKLPIESITPAIQPAGNINEIQYEPIKTALLRYYRRPTLPASEKNILDNLMTFAFPNGVPLVNMHSAPVINNGRLGDDGNMGNIIDQIKPGASLYMNTVPGSCFHHLDNQCVLVTGLDNKGVWVCTHNTGPEPVMTHLPYKDKEQGTFWSVPRIMLTDKTVSHAKTYMDKFDEAKRLGTLLSQIMVGEERVRINPETDQIIVPTRLNKKRYNYQLGTVCDINPNLAGDTTGPVTSDNELVVNTKRQLDGEQLMNNILSSAAASSNNEYATVDQAGGSMSGRESISDGKQMDLAEFFNPPPTAGIHDLAEAQTTITTEQQQQGLFNNDNTVVIRRQVADETEAEYLSESENSDSDNFSESNLEFVDEPVEILETVQKLRQMPVPELEKVFRDSVLKGELLKQKLQKLPTFLRDNTYYNDRIHKEVNIISLIKNKVTLDNKHVKLQPEGYKPLLDQYMKRDFSAGFLIPLVISTKKIYLTKRDGASADDYNRESSYVVEDFYKHMHLLEKEAKLGGKKRVIDLEAELGRTFNDQLPNVVHQSNLGFLVRLGEGIQPEVPLNPDTTTKLKMDRAAERIHHLNQQTTVIRYGKGKSFNIQNYSVMPKDFDSFVALGPMANFPPDDKTKYTVEELEALEEQVDRNISAVSSRYNMYYLGDNISIIGFVRPPLHDFMFPETLLESRDSITTQLDTDNVIIRELDQMETEITTPTGETIHPSLADPDKYIVYLIPGIDSTTQKRGKHTETILNQDALRVYLDRAIPQLKDITALFRSEYDVANMGDLRSLIDVLYKFDYIVPSMERPGSSTESRMREEVTYEQAATLREIEAKITQAMVDYSDRLDKLCKLNDIRKKKQHEKQALTSKKGIMHHNSALETLGKSLVINNNLIEIADKVYGEAFNVTAGTGPTAYTDEYRMDYYSHQVDRSRYIELLLRKYHLEDIQKHLNPEMLENAMFILKEKYENLAKSRPDLEAQIPKDLADKVKICNTRIDRKPKILKYPTLDRLKEDNGKVAMTPRGDMILEGDFGYVVEGETRHLFKRESLADGEYWIGQPITVLESLLFKKKSECSADEKLAELDAKRAGMRLPDEQLVGTSSDSAAKSATEDKILSPEELAQCIFDVETIKCLPPDVIAVDKDLRDLEMQIREIKAQIDLSSSIGPLIADCEKLIRQSEKEIRNYNNGVDAVNKYFTALAGQRQKELEAMIKRKKDCPHFNVIDYLNSLHNLSPIERYMLVKQIIDRFQNAEQASGLDLLELNMDRTLNNIECHICSQTLICKHYAYAIELMSNSPNGELDEEQLREVYGEEISGSYYCRNCGVYLSNTPVQDIEEFEKDAAKEGMHVQTRSVLEELDIVERQKKAVDVIISQALQDPTDDDIRFKLRIYKLLKDLCGLDVLSIEDELDMVNFIKSYDYISRKTFFNMLFLKFLRAKGGVATGINQTVVDKLADEQYWKHVTCDIAARFLVTLQTSIQTYPVFNKLCTNNYIGWPLLGGREPDAAAEDAGGVDLIICIMKQMSILPEFKYLAGGESGFEGVKQLFIRRTDELVRNNELVRTKLDRALNHKYEQISLMEEFAGNPTNFWSSFRPSMSDETSVKWTPKHDLTPTVLEEWTPKTLYNMIQAGKENIIYQTHVLKARINDIVKDDGPANRMGLMTTTVANSCCPIDYSVLTQNQSNPSELGDSTTEHSKYTDKSIKSKYINPDINYFTLFEKSSEAVRNALRRIREYQTLIEQLETVNVTPTIKVIYPMDIFNVKREPMNLALTADELKAYFLKYISHGSSKGEEHLYDPYGRCLISNMLKKDVENVTYGQADFDNLFREVSRKHIVQNPEIVIPKRGQSPYKDNAILTDFVNAIYQVKEVISGRDMLISKELDSLVTQFETVNTQRILELIDSNLAANKQVEKLTSDYLTLHDVIKLTKRLEAIIPKYGKRFMDYMVKCIRLVNGYFSEFMWNSVGYQFPEYVVTATQRGPVKFDIKKEYFGLLSFIENDKQANIADIIETIGVNQKEELSMEARLINLAELKDISGDIRNFILAQEKIIPHIDYFNIDVEVEKQHQVARLTLIRKIIYDIRTIINNIKNGTWSGLKSVDDMYYNIRAFFIYKDNRAQFTKLAALANVIYAMVDKLRPINLLFVQEHNLAIVHYLCILMLSGFLELVNDSTTRDSGKKSKGDKISSLEYETPEEPDTNIETGKPDFRFIKTNDQIADELTNANSEYGVSNDAELDVDLYPELASNNGNGEEDEPGQPESADSLSSSKLIEVKTTQRNLVVNFIKDCIKYITELEHVYNEMNLTRIREQMDKTNELQTKLNLRVPKFLAQEGMEDDYRMVRNLLSLGFLELKELNQFMLQNFGEDIFRGEEAMTPELEEPADTGVRGEDIEGSNNARREEQARNNKYGLNNEEMEEMGYVGEAEDIEEQDYGYLAVDD